MAITKSKKREIRARIAIALSLSSMRLDKMGRSFKNEPECDFVKIREVVLTPETVVFFQKAFEDESDYVKPDIARFQLSYVQNSKNFIEAVDSALKSFYFDEDVRSGDRDKIVKACYNYALLADVLSVGYADRFLLDIQSYIVTNRGVAAQLLNCAFERLSLNGNLVAKVEKLKELKKALEASE